jgi:DNA-directed RNA polymerase subunit H (RpoH/RPB5)
MEWLVAIFHRWAPENNVLSKMRSQSCVSMYELGKWKLPRLAGSAFRKSWKLVEGRLDRTDTTNRDG